MRLFRRTGLRMILAAAVFPGLMAMGCRGRQEAPPPPPPPEVAVLTIQPQEMLLTTELAGRTSAYRIAEIRPQVSGLIQKRLFTEGADVKAGDVLYQIDPATFQAALGNASAALGRSEANLPALRSRAERYRELLAQKAVSRQDYEDAVGALKQAEADAEYWKSSVDTARINLAYTRITAPISGRIGRSGVTEGAIVTAYQPTPLATIQQLDPIYVDVPQSTTELLRLKRRFEDGRLNRAGNGQRAVRLVMEDGADYPHEGSFQFRDVTVDPTTGSVILRVVFPNPDGMLLPGMFVRAVMKEGVDEAAILIPQQSVARDPKGNPTALVVDAGDTVKQRMLTVDRAIGNQWLVTSGLAQGDRIIVEGLQKARPGAAVKVVPYMADARESGSKSDPETQAAPQSN
ncbi:MAG: efflux RND transporter periplasmic adaptor subunit [Desulfobacterales bacterium]